MLSLGGLVIVAIVIAIALAARGRTPGERGRPVADAIGQWVAAGLLTPEQADALRAYEQAPTPAAGPTVPRPATPSPARRVAVVAEAMGYLGGILALVGLALVVARYWPDMATAARLGLSGVGAVVFSGAGVLVSESADPALARLRGFLWLLATAALGLFTGLLAVDAFGVTTTETVVLMCAGVVATASALLWSGRERPLQQLTFLGAVVVFGGALTAEVTGPGPVGLTIWAFGALYLALGLRRHIPQPLLGEGVGAVAIVIGAMMVASEWQAFGLLFATASAIGLLALAVVPGAARTTADIAVLAASGAIAFLFLTPGTVAYFAHDAAGATALVIWAFGAALLAVGARRLVRQPMLVEAFGAVALVGAAALIAIQWTGFAPLFGIATALGLIAIGMLPGQVLMSVFGSVGLLVNIPWAIGYYFPGEGRVPLLLFVSGVLIIVVAVFLARMGGRFRRELGGPDRVRRHRPPPTRIASGTSP
jgi:hypothetical protein